MWKITFDCRYSNYCYKSYSVDHYFNPRNIESMLIIQAAFLALGFE